MLEKQIPFTERTHRFFSYLGKGNTGNQGGRVQ